MLSSSQGSDTLGCMSVVVDCDNPEPFDEGRESLPGRCGTVLERCLPSTLSMPKPMGTPEPRAFSRDFLDEIDLMDFVGLEGVGVLSSEGAGIGVALPDLTEAADCLGDMITESWGRDGSSAVLRCKKRVGESGLLCLEVCMSSRVRDVVLLSLDET